MKSLLFYRTRLFIYKYNCLSPKSLIWPGKTARLWAQEAQGMSSAASPPHFLFLRARSACARSAPLALCSPLIYSGSDGLRRSFPKKKERAVSHRDVDSFSAPNEMGNFSPLSRTLSSSRPGTRRSNNRRGAPQYTIARSNRESSPTGGQLQFTKPRFISCSDCGLVQGY